MFLSGMLTWRAVKWGQAQPDRIDAKFALDILFEPAACFLLCYSWHKQGDTYIKIKYLQRFSKCTTSLFCSEYCEEKFPHVTADKLKRDLTCKCGEERRKMKKGGR